MQIHGKRVMYWLEGEAQQNFGDFLTEYLADGLIQRMLGSADSYRLIGSAICEAIIRDDLQAANATQNGKVAFWGCGARDDRALAPEYLAKAEFFGVRGPLTRKLLGLPADVTIGDPAFLLPLFHTRKTSPRTAGKRICVPHFLDRKDDEAILAETGADLVLRPSVANSRDALKAILDDIASADFVLAGSLHAAVVACAYDRPFAYYDAGHVDIPFKWRDFAASIGVSPLYVGTVADGQSIYEQFLNNRIIKPALFPLLAGAPFVAKLPMLLAAVRHDAGAPMNDQTFATLTRSLDHLLDRYQLAEALQGENAALGADFAEARARTEALAVELAAARQEGDALRGALAQAEATTRALAERIGELEGLHTRVADCEAALQESAELLASAKAGLANADVALQDRTTQLQATRNHLAALEATAQQKDGLLEEKTGLLENSQKRLADTEAALGETARRASAQEAELSDLQAALAAARQEVVRQKEKRFSRRFRRFFRRSGG